AAIKTKVLGVRHAHVPLANWFLIHRPDSCKTFIAEIFRQISADKATRTGYDYKFVFAHKIVALSVQRLEVSVQPVTAYVDRSRMFHIRVLNHTSDQRGLRDKAASPATRGQFLKRFE